MRTAPKINFATQSDLRFFEDHFKEPSVLDLIEKFANQEYATWKQLIHPEAANNYLISDRGKVIQIDPPQPLKVTLFGGSTDAYYLRLPNSEIYKRHPIQRLMAFSFKQLPLEVAKNPLDFQVVHLDGDPNDLNLSKLYFVKKAGRNRRFTLSQILKMRELYATGEYPIAGIARHFKSSWWTTSQIIKNKCWILPDEPPKLEVKTKTFTVAGYNKETFREE